MWQPEKFHVKVIEPSGITGWSKYTGEGSKQQ